MAIKNEADLCFLVRKDINTFKLKRKAQYVQTDLGGRGENHKQTVTMNMCYFCNNSNSITKVLNIQLFEK